MIESHAKNQSQKREFLSHNLSFFMAQSTCKFDQKSKDIVFGYIKSIQKSFKSSYIVPNAVSWLCLIYIDDYFMLNQGTFRWIFENEALNNFVTTPCAQSIESKVFDVGKLPWKVIIFPNGENLATINSVNVYLTLVSLPSIWNSILARCTIKCIETNISHTFLSNYVSRASLGWQPGTQLLSEISTNQNLSQLTFEIKIHILTIFTITNGVHYWYKLDHKSNTKLRYNWAIDPAQMAIMHESKLRAQYESPVFDEMWVIKIIPNSGPQYNGKILLYLQLCALPPQLYQIPVTWRIICKEWGFDEEYFNQFGVTVSSALVNKDIAITFDEFKNYDTIDITIEIETENDDRVINEWNNYCSDEKKEDITVEEFVDKIREMSEKLDTVSKKIDQLISDRNPKQESTISSDVKIDEDNEVYQWLNDTVKLSEYGMVFIQNGYDKLLFVQDMDRIDLIDIGINKIGHQKRIIKCIETLKNDFNK